MNKSMFQKGSVLQKPFAQLKAPAVQEEPDLKEVTEIAFFESVGEDAMLESISKLANSAIRQEAASAVLQWVAGGDAGFDELDALMFGFATDENVDDKEYELNSSEEEYYDELSSAVAEYLSQFVDGVDIELMAEDDEVSERVFAAVESGLDGMDSDESVADFAVRENMMTEAAKTVVRNGKFIMVKKPKRKRRMTAAQKAGLKKARRKAHTAAAKAKRKKAKKMRASRGLQN